MRLHSIIHSLLCFSILWIRMTGFIILFSVCFSKEPWAKLMVHLNSKPNYNGKTCGEQLALMLDQGCQFDWRVFLVNTPIRKTFTESGRSVTASSRDKEVTLVCFIWCAKRFDVILDDLYCCFNKSQLLFFSIFISLLLIKLLEYCWCSRVESDHIWFAINVSYYFVTKIIF